MTRSRHRFGLLASVIALALALPVQVASAAGVGFFEGRLQVTHGENFAAQQEFWNYELVASDGATYRLDFGGEGPDGFLNGAHVRVRGNRAAPGVVAVGPAAADAQVVAEATVSAPTSRRVALLLVNFLTNTTQPWTLSQAASIAFSAANSVANYFGEESYGQMAVTGDVYGYFTIDFNTSACNYSDLANKAKSAATAAGVNLSEYTNIEYAFPHVSACGWSGLAYLPGTESWINNALGLYVSAHELSHNFGVHHASTINCSEGGVRVPLSATASNCSVSEYGDPFSILGSGSTRHTHNQQKASLGWIPSGEWITVSSSGTYSLGAAEDFNLAPKILRIARGNGTYLYLELRQPWGVYFDNFAPTSAVVNGISLRIANNWTTIIQSKLIDTTPLTTSYLDSALAVGSSFTDPLSGVSVTTVSVSAGVATVNITWGPDAIPPTAPTNLLVAATGASTANLTWTASTDNLGVAHYQVSRDGTVRGNPTGTSFADSGLVGGQTYAYSVVAYDAAGNVSGAATRNWTQPIPDTAAPTAPTNLRTTSVTRAKISLAWNASTDNVGVAGYRIYRDGVLWVTTTGTSHTGSRANKVYTYTVFAYDAAGNVSAVSNSLRV